MLCMCPFYQELEELASQSEKLDEPEINEGLVSMVQSLLSCCAQAKGSVVEQRNSVTTHSTSIFTGPDASQEA